MTHFTLLGDPTQHLIQPNLLGPCLRLSSRNDAFDFIPVLLSLVHSVGFLGHVVLVVHVDALPVQKNESVKRSNTGTIP